MQKCKSVSTLIDPSLPFFKATQYDTRCEQQLYQELTSSLNHFALFSRPDISWSVFYLSQFLTDSTETHLLIAYHVLRYLNDTRHYSITFSKTSMWDILGYCNGPGA